jgi:parallel beta-helix repeat protein
MKTLTSSDRFYPFDQFKILFFFLLLLSATAKATVWYVKPGGTGTGSGSWANAAAATSLATIITGAASGDEVWVVGSTAGTTYLPTATTTRTIAFTLKSGVSVYGGFAGTETALGQQNPATYITILSGNITGATGGESYNVVVSSGNTGNTLLNGFTIEDGNANSTGQYSTGGGVYNSGTTVTYSHCIITGNTAIGNGGGVYITGSGTVNFDTCTFSYNSTTVSFAQTNGGGGVYCGGETTNFIDCIFSYNTSTSEGGGVLTNGTVGTFSNCTFRHNSSSNDGGGFYLYQNGTYSFSNCAFDTCTATGNGGGIVLASISNVPFHYCSFVGNASEITGADYGGGGFYASSGSSDTIANCVFSGNSASSYGGGIECNGMNGLVMRYTTFSQNNASVYGGAFSNVGGSSFLISNCHFSNNAAPSGGGLYIDGGGQTLSYDTVSNNTATASSGVGGGGLFEDPGTGTNTIVSHCWFMGNVTNGSNGGAIYDNSAQADSNTVFQANIVKGTGGSGGAIYHDSQTGNIINCVFVDNECSGYGGGYYDNATNEEVENCTFYNNTATTAGAGMYDVGGGNPKYYGVITWNNHPDGFALGVGSTSGFKIRYCDFQAALTITGGSIANNQAIDPLFSDSTNYVGGDGKWATGDDGLHLAYSPNISPLADYQQSNYPANDIAEVSRPYVGNTYADEGAYEGPDPVLALFLLDFTATAAGSHTVDLHWDVSDASQISQFQLQRSTDGVSYSTIDVVDAMAGQTGYAAVDDNALGTVLYYRLSITHLGGNLEYSPTEIVRITPAVQAVQLSVWPSVSALGPRTLYIGSPGPMSEGMILSDVTGHIVWRKNVQVVQGDNYLSVDVSDLAGGVYYLTVIGQDGSKTALMLEKL